MRWKFTGICLLSFVVLLVLQLTNVIDWSWWIITSPIWGWLIVMIVIIGFLLRVANYLFTLLLKLLG